MKRHEQDLKELMHGCQRVEEIASLLPPGDRRAEVAKIARRIREMVCEMDGAIESGRDVTNLAARINNLINIVLQ